MPDQLRRAVRDVVSDWRARGPTQLRESLPPDISCSMLRYIRANACRLTAGNAGEAIDCAKWMPDPLPYQTANIQLVSQSTRRPVVVRTADYVCNQCKHPRVTNSALIQRLGLTHDVEDFSERTWRRYVNDAKPMPIDRLRRVIANAFAEDWLGLWQCISIWKRIDELHATQAGLRALIARVAQRKAYVEQGKVDLSPREIVAELTKQMRLLDRESIDMIHKRLQRNDLPPEVRELFLEVLADWQAAAKSP